jgi:tripartite ATP-independent transporter DctM subunit
LTAASYCAVVLLIAFLRPDIIPPAAPVPRGDTAQALRQTAPILVLILLVLGGLFSGLFTATEAGAVGALGTVIVAAVSGNLTRASLTRSLNETVLTTGSILIIGVAATMFTRFLGLSGLAGAISTAVTDAGTGYLTLMLVIIVIYLILGCFMEPFGAMLVTLPVFLPLVEAQGLSLVWFGVLVVKLLEIGMITPPVGLNVFVIKNVASRYVTLVDVFRGVLPFFAADLVVVAIIVMAPAMVLFLPGLVS